MNTVKYIKKLESLIEDGEKLRDEMRQLSAKKDAIIRRQAGELKNISQLNHALRERRCRASTWLNKSRNETRSAKAKLEKMQGRRGKQQEYTDQLKADLEKYRELAGVMYQAAGAYDMPERIMDLLSAAQGGKPFGHLLDVLPVWPPDDLAITLPDISCKAFWSGTGKNEVFHPEAYRRQVKEAIERGCVIAGIGVEVKS